MHCRKRIYSCKCVIAIYVILCAHISTVHSSAGDRSHHFQACIQSDVKHKCQTNEGLAKFASDQGIAEKWLGWSCKDDCRYNCMWKTVKAYQAQGIDVPQFNGKWPFVRFLGIQEPASMLFSIFNAYTHVLGLRLYISQINSRNRLYFPSLMFSVMSINAWLWSTIFHTRDFDFTEKMDYFSATAAVFYSIYYCTFRMSLGISCPDPKRGRNIQVLTGVILGGLFIRHVSCLVEFFDYGYNMLVNVAAGLLNGVFWVMYHILTRKHFSHQWMATTAVLYTVLLLGLELLDFPPIFWVFDAHSLWHLGTVGFAFLWYPFMVEESKLCRYV